MALIFISYSHDDYDFVRGFADELRNRHFLVWLDRNEGLQGRGIDPGTDWREEIKKGIKDSGAIVVIVSPKALASKWVSDEIKTAQDAHKPIY